MQTTALSGGFDHAPHEAARAFRAAMEAMARPGTIHRVAGGRGPAPLSVGAATLILTLCDGDTPLFIGRGHDLPDVRDWIRFHTGAPLAPAADCAFAIGHWDDLCPLGAYRVGTPDYPDRSATLIVDTDRLDADGPLLHGPGVAPGTRLRIPGPEIFARPAFPLGLDVFLSCGDRIAALPRTARPGEGH